MEELLNEIVPQEDLEVRKKVCSLFSYNEKLFSFQRFERKYHQELELDGEVTTETKFEYVII